MSFIDIPPDLIISRDAKGNVLSRFEDPFWDVEPYCLTNKDKTYLKLIEDREIDLEIGEANFYKRMLLIAMFSPNKTGKPLRITTLASVEFLLSAMKTFSTEQNISPTNIFGSSSTFKKFIDTYHGESSLKSLVSLSRKLLHLSEKEVGFCIDGAIRPQIKKIAKTRPEGKQTPIIPSRILFTKYQHYMEKINDYLENKDKLSNLLALICENHSYARALDGGTFSKYHPYEKSNPFSSHHHRRLIMAEHVDFDTAIQRHDLTKLSNKYNWTSVTEIASFLTTVQYCSKCMIHIFTTMRDEEALALQPECLEPVIGWNKKTVYVLSVTTKMKGRAVKSKWISCPEIAIPLSALEQIRKDIVCNSAQPNNELKDLLFAAVAKLPFSPGAPSKKNKGRSASGFASRVEQKLPQVLITEDDMRELEAIDPFRDWRADKQFKIGQPWKITSHQFRRSIAVYAAQSGLVTLPALKRLLQHLTKEMSLYYAKGCSAGNVIFMEDNPFAIAYFLRNKKAADAAMYIKEVLKSKEELYGIHGMLIDNKRNNIIMKTSIEQTKINVEKGFQAYQETPVGGCGSVTPCNKRAHGNFLTCDTCSESVIKMSAVSNIISVAQMHLKTLNPDTIEYRAELANLQDLENFVVRIKKQKAKQSKN
ncbi:hypothetical protein C1X57_19800 [Pseudomonas sp. FW215-E1]|nr:hypothetical protein C1X57_19800 [Pseudomonas sp. FW215-E1]